MICGNYRVNGCATIISERGNILCESCKNALKTRKETISEEVKLRLRDFEIQILDLGRKNSILEKEKVELEDKVEKLEKLNTETPESVKNLKIQIDHLQGELEGKNLKILSLERENERVLDGKSYFEADNAGLKSKISLLERELQKKTIKTTTMEGKILALEKELDMNKKNLEKELERNEVFEKKLNEKDVELSKMKDLEFRLSSSETARETLVSQLETLRQSVALQLETEKRSFASQLETARQSVALQLETEKKYFHSELDSIQKEKTVLENTLTYLRKENELLKDSISSEKSSSAENSSYEEKYRKLLQEHFELKSWMEKETETFVSSLRKKQEELEVIMKEKTTFEKIYNQLQIDYEKLNLDLQRFTTQLPPEKPSEKQPLSLAEQIEMEKAVEKTENTEKPIEVLQEPQKVVPKGPPVKVPPVKVPKKTETTTKTTTKTLRKEPKPLSRVVSMPVKTQKRVI